MNDTAIVELYFARSERALEETHAKYGAFLERISYNILASREDAQECVNDTYTAAWNTIPPTRPASLSAYLGRLTRGLSIDRWRMHRAKKRGGGEITLALDELSECIPGGGDPAHEVERRELRDTVDGFLATLGADERMVFMRRYWYMDTVPDIARRYGFTRAKVTSMLHRTREKLREVLIKEGY